LGEQRRFLAAASAWLDSCFFDSLLAFLRAVVPDE